ncbi:MAG: gamma-glutamyltransferase, partial [Anaerolineae bacterium]|nr:gamma-glutamyltransferase [Anaerolineae bacterium]
GEPDLLSIEGRVPDSTLRQLREMGHDVRVTGDWSDAMGQAQGIVVDAEHGVFHGGADPRGDGQAIGW